MSQIVAFELKDNAVLVAIARASGRRIQIDKTFSLEISGDQQAAQIGLELREELRKHHVSRCDAIAVIGRSDCEMREIEVPPAPDSELPDLVRFKARSEFGSLNENWALDFVPFSDDATQSRDVLAIAVAPELVEQLQTIADEAHLKLKHIVFRPFATVNLLRSRLLDGKSRMVVDVDDTRVELLVTRGTQVVSTRRVVVPTSLEGDARVKHSAGQIRRTIASSQKRLGGNEVSEIIICGANPDRQSMADQLAQSLGIDTNLVEPFDLAPAKASLVRPADSQKFSAVLGALLQHDAGIGHEIDFLHPRKRESKKANIRRPLIIGGAAVAALAFLGLLGWWVLSSQASEIEQLTKQLNSKKDLNQGIVNGVQAGTPVEQIIGEVKRIDNWKQMDVNALDELYEISKRLALPDDAMINSLNASLRRDQYTVSLKGVAANDRAETEIKKELATRPFHVIPEDTRTVDVPFYSRSFEFTMLSEMDRPEIIKELTERAREHKKSMMQTREETAENETEEPTAE